MMDLIDEAELRKSVCGFRNWHEKLVKESPE